MGRAGRPAAGRLTDRTIIRRRAWALSFLTSGAQLSGLPGCRGHHTRRRWTPQRAQHRLARRPFPAGREQCCVPAGSGAPGFGEAEGLHPSRLAEPKGCCAENGGTWLTYASACPRGPMSPRGRSVGRGDPRFPAHLAPCPQIRCDSVDRVSVMVKLTQSLSTPFSDATAGERPSRHAGRQLARPSAKAQCPVTLAA